MFQNITQVSLLMIPNGEKWRNFVVKALSALLRGIMSKHHGDFYCLPSFFCNRRQT